MNEYSCSIDELNRDGLRNLIIKLEDKIKKDAHFLTDREIWLLTTAVIQSIQRCGEDKKKMISIWASPLKCLSIFQTDEALKAKEKFNYEP